MITIGMDIVFDSIICDVSKNFNTENSLNTNGFNDIYFKNGTRIKSISLDANGKRYVILPDEVISGTGDKYKLSIQFKIDPDCYTDEDIFMNDMRTISKINSIKFYNSENDKCNPLKLINMHIMKSESVVFVPKNVTDEYKFNNSIKDNTGVAITISISMKQEVNLYSGDDYDFDYNTESFKRKYVRNLISGNRDELEDKLIRAMDIKIKRVVPLIKMY